MKNSHDKAFRAHVYGQLPFVSMTKGEPRNFWAPRSRGDYYMDCELGTAYAEAARGTGLRLAWRLG